MASVTSVVKHHGTIGDLLFKIVELTGDAAGSTDIPVKEIGLKYAVACWSQGIDDNVNLQWSTYSGTTLVSDAIGDGEKQYLFVIGY